MTAPPPEDRAHSTSGGATGTCAMTDPPASPWRGPLLASTVGMVGIVVISAFESLAVATAMPIVARDLGAMGLYATAFAAPLASGVVGMTAAGAWADRRGPRQPLLVSMVFFVVGLLVSGLAPSMLVLVAGRIVQGLGLGGSVVALYVLVARVYPERLRPQVFAAFSAAWVVPGIVGPALAGLVADHLGWRWVFLGVPILAVPAAALLRRALSDPATARGTDHEDTAEDIAPAAGPAVDATHRRGPLGWFSRHAVLASTVAGTGVLALHQGGQAEGAWAVPWLALGTLALVWTVPGLLPAGTLTARRGLPAAVALRGLTAAAFFGTETFLPLLLQTQRGMTATEAGLVLTASTVTWALGSWVRGRTLHRPDSALLVVGTVCITISIALAALLVWPAWPLWAGFLGWGIGGFGMGLAQPTISLLVLRVSPVAQQGQNSSALQVVDGVATSTMLALSGVLLTALGGPEAAVAFAAGFAVTWLVSLLSVAVAPRTRTS